MHPSLELLVQKNLYKLLVEKIIFPVHCTEWMANLLTDYKKFGEVRLTIEFHNLNRASKKDNYHAPQME